MSVVVYLMRHGIAEEPSRGVSDADRALTEDGVRKTTRVAEGLRALGVVPDAILSSPLRRADETARIAGGILAPDCAITFTPLLAGDTPTEAIAKCLRPPRAARQVMLVGHQPGLGELASDLMTGAADLSPLPFKKAASPPSRSTPFPRTRRPPALVPLSCPSARHRRQPQIVAARRFLRPSSSILHAADTGGNSIPPYSGTRHRSAAPKQPRSAKGPRGPSSNRSVRQSDRTRWTYGWQRNFSPLSFILPNERFPRKDRNSNDGAACRKIPGPGRDGRRHR